MKTLKKTYFSLINRYISYQYNINRYTKNPIPQILAPYWSFPNIEVQPCSRHRRKFGQRKKNDWISKKENRDLILIALKNKLLLLYNSQSESIFMHGQERGLNISSAAARNVHEVSHTKKIYDEVKDECTTNTFTGIFMSINKSRE